MEDEVDNNVLLWIDHHTPGRDAGRQHQQQENHYKSATTDNDSVSDLQ